MLNYATIEQTKKLTTWFDLSGFESSSSILVDDQTQAYTIRNSNVRLKVMPEDHKLPLKFDSVGGAFVAMRMGLDTLEGGPRHVSAGYFVSDNNLTNLLHAPDMVPGVLSVTNNPLESLVGWPASGVNTCNLNYSAHLPLLRTINTTEQIRLLDYAPPEVAQILNKYRGQGKTGAIKAAAELIRAGYKDNARW